MTTLLSAHAVAETGGERELAARPRPTTTSPRTRGSGESIRVVHTIEASQRLHNINPTHEELAVRRSRPAKGHALVWTHQSGRKSLVPGGTASHVAGMEQEQGHAFLVELRAKVTVPHRVYRHEWSVGDMVIWDDRGVVHRACPYDQTAPRDMHRTTLHGDEPVQ